MNDYKDAARIVSAAGSLFLSGYMSSFSQNTVPLIYDQPAAIGTPIFSGVYYQGLALVAPLSLISAASSAYSAYTNPGQRGLHSSAGALTISILAFTRLFMYRGINQLLDLSTAPTAAHEKADRSGEIKPLLRAWVSANWVRVGLTFAGGMTSLWTILDAR